MQTERIRALREDKDWSQQKLADMLHINRRTYSAYETGVNAIPLDILAALARIYGTSTDYLLGLTENKNHSNTEPYRLSRMPMISARASWAASETMVAPLSRTAGAQLAGAKPSAATASMERSLDSSPAQ